MMEVLSMASGISSAPPWHAERMPGIPPRFLARSDPIPACHEGRCGIRGGIWLTDYHSLPLSCLAGIDIRPLDLDANRPD